MARRLPEISSRVKATLAWFLCFIVVLQPMGPQVTLEEVGSVALPSGFRPIGIAIGHGQIFVWGCYNGAFRGG